ncbi:MAG: MgtC/SapB family protein [Oscillospiraceae bacterium]|nr:MgtC/SapB family protein [Oscillospiraceae bacterium]
MLSLLDPLREFNFAGVVVRLLLALVSGGVIGYGRSKKNCAAGLRTYMLISLGAALSVLLTLYEYRMLHTYWADALVLVGEKFDASRLASQAITGIGFLGAGTILKTAHQQVSGLTTATGLLATVCMSLAAGAGFYECVILALILTVLVLNVLSPMEVMYKRRLRNITLTVEMDSVDDVAVITEAIEQERAKVYEVDVESVEEPVSAIFILQMERENSSHSAMLCSVAMLDCVRSVQELIS